MTICRDGALAGVTGEHLELLLATGKLSVQDSKATQTTSMFVYKMPRGTPED